MQDNLHLDNIFFGMAKASKLSLLAFKSCVIFNALPSKPLSFGLKLNCFLEKHRTF